MDVPRAIRYIAAVDVLEKASAQEADVHRRNSQDPSTSLPLHSGLEGAAEIYKMRATTVAKYAGSILCRWTGVDAVYRIATGSDFPH